MNIVTKAFGCFGKRYTTYRINKNTFEKQFKHILKNEKVKK